MDRFTISTLRSYYGALLTQKQNEMLKMRYDEDLSFGEIAEIEGISRQAALDGIVKGENHLARIDEKLGFLKRDERIKQAAQNLLALSSEESVRAAVNEILSILEE